MKRVLSIAALGISGCLGTPTPLAPGIGGSVGVPHQGCRRTPWSFPLAVLVSSGIDLRAVITGATRGSFAHSNAPPERSPRRVPAVLRS